MVKVKGWLKNNSREKMADSLQRSSVSKQTVCQLFCRLFETKPFIISNDKQTNIFSIYQNGEKLKSRKKTHFLTKEHRKYQNTDLSSVKVL